MYVARDEKRDESKSLKIADEDDWTLAETPPSPASVTSQAKQSTGGQSKYCIWLEMT